MRPDLFFVDTFELVPGSLAEVEGRLAESYRDRGGTGDVVASLHTEIGPLNQIVQLRAPAPGQEGGSRAGRGWPAAALERVVERRTEPFRPLAISPVLAPAAVGPYFELRIYDCAEPEDPARLESGWRAALPARLEWGPLVVVGHGVGDASRRFLHLWPYRSLDARAELRRGVRAAGIWPPAIVARRLGLPAWTLTRQENRILVPASFSPLR